MEPKQNAWSSQPQLDIWPKSPFCQYLDFSLTNQTHNSMLESDFIYNVPNRYVC